MREGFEKAQEQLITTIELFRRPPSLIDAEIRRSRHKHVFYNYPLSPLRTPSVVIDSLLTFAQKVIKKLDYDCGETD